MMILSKKFLSILVIVMTVSPNACFVEQVVAAVADTFLHEHQQDEAHGDDRPAPSHHHDDEGHESEFCCDNEKNFYIGSIFDQNLDLVQNPVLYLPIIYNLEETENPFQRDFYFFHRLREPQISRTRDKYALSCLLNAPPRSN